MSTGADCYFVEEKTGLWRCYLQEWPYGEWDVYSKSPLTTLEAAMRWLDQFANPGGWSYVTAPGVEHQHEFQSEDGKDWCVACPATRNENGIVKEPEPKGV